MRREQIATRIRIDDVYRDAWRIYKLLFRRSVVTAAIICAAIGVVDAVRHIPARYGYGVSMCP